MAAGGGGPGAEEGKGEEKKRKTSVSYPLGNFCPLFLADVSLSGQSPNSSAVIHKSFDDAAS